MSRDLNTFDQYLINAITIAEYVESMATSHLAKCLVTAIDSLPQARQVRRDEQLAMRLPTRVSREGTAEKRSVFVVKSLNSSFPISLHNANSTKNLSPDIIPVR